MVEPTRSRGRAATWRPWSAAGRRPAPQWLDVLGDFLRARRERLREWALAEVGARAPRALARDRVRQRHHRVFHRRPGAGAVGGASRSSLRQSCSAVLARRRPVAFPVMLGIAAAAAGFAAATAKRVLISHPVLSAPVWNADVAGFVEVREERERSDRIVVRVERIAGPRLNETLERVRVSVRKGTAPAVGSFVEFKARLSPPLAPLRPGGYDFARDMYFQGIGASGFVLGRIRTVAAREGAFALVALCRRHRKYARGDRPAHPGGRARRSGCDCIRAHYRQTRRAHRAGVRRHVRVGHRPRAVDLRLSHGGGGGHHLLCAACIIRVDAGIHGPPFDQEMGGVRGTLRGGVLSSALRRRGRDPTLVHHDRDRPRRRDGGSSDPDVPDHYRRGALRAAAAA